MRALRRFRALGERARWRLDDEIRIRRFSDQPGFPKRTRLDLEITQAARPGDAPFQLALGAPASERVGLLVRGDGPSGDQPEGMAGRLASLLGLEGMPVPRSRWTQGVARAVSERWPLLVLSLGDGDLGAGNLDGLRRYVEEGGVLLVVVEDDGGAARNLDEVRRAVVRNLPVARACPGDAGHLRFTVDVPEITGSLTGIAVPVRRSPHWHLELAPGTRPLAWVGAGGDRVVSSLTPVGRGAVVVSVDGARVRGPLRDALEPEQWPALALPLLLLRALYGERAWHPPGTLANLTIDDPALTSGRLGLDYPRLLGLAEAGDYHVSIATIPRELGVADPEVLGLLRRYPSRLTACYHGWNHSGYEFFLTEGSGNRFRARPLEAQRLGVERSAAAGRALWNRSRVALDRVMVFPHGIGPAALLPGLPENGFLASCNLDDRDPLGAAPPATTDLGVRGADTAWGGVPLLWRRGLTDPRFAIDALLGRPLLAFGHRRKLGPDLEPFAEYARRVRTAVPEVRWAGLEAVALHAYLTRRDRHDRWQVLMTADDICLHNPGAETRTYHLRRPHQPPDAELSRRAVEVGAGARVRIHLDRAGGGTLPGPVAVCPLDPEGGLAQDLVREATLTV